MCPLWCAICRHILWNVLLERCAKALKTNKPFSSLQPSNWTKTKTYDVWNCNKISKIPRGSKGALASPTILVSYNRAPRKKNCRIFTLMDFKAALGLISSRGLLVICSKYARETHQPFGASSAIDHFSTVRWLGPYYLLLHSLGTNTKTPNFEHYETMSSNPLSPCSDRKQSTFDENNLWSVLQLSARLYCPLKSVSIEWTVMGIYF